MTEPVVTDQTIRINGQHLIEEKGSGLVFEFQPGSFERGFVVRFGGNLFAYRNRCPHTGSELDWVEGRFFDQDRKYITCSTHGALFEVTTGKCIHGPCLGQSLQSLPIQIVGQNMMIKIENG